MFTINGKLSIKIVIAQSYLSSEAPCATQGPAMLVNLKLLHYLI